MYETTFLFSCELCHGALKHHGAFTIKLKPGMERHEVDVNIRQQELE